MAEVSKNTKYVKLDDGVSFSLVRTNPKLTTNTKLMYNGKKMYMESYAAGELMNRTMYKNKSIKPKSTYNKDIADFLVGTGSQAYNVYQNFSDIAISDSYDNQFETLYWCGAEYIDSYAYDEEIGFVAPLYLREKLPNYFLIFRLDTPSNYNLTLDKKGNVKDSEFDFKKDILDKAVLIKTFDLREGSVLGNYIHNYIEQDLFEFDKSMYINFSNSEVTYYGINRSNGILEKKVENFANELLKSDNPILKNDKWFTEGFERNGLIFPYIMNIEYLFDDDNFKHNGGESYDFARYIGLYCNNIEFGEFDTLDELNTGETQDNAIYYFEDNKNNLHRYTSNKTEDESKIKLDFKIDGKESTLFDKKLIEGFEKERISGYAEPLDINEGFVNRAQYGFEILKPLEPGDWIGIHYNDKDNKTYSYFYFADNRNNIGDDKYSEMNVGEHYNFRFSVSDNSTLNDIADALVKSINLNKESKFEAKCFENSVVIYAKREGKEFNGAKMLMEASLIYNGKISLPISNNVKYVDDYKDIDIDDSDYYVYGNFYIDSFCGACELYIDKNTETYKNIFKIYADEAIFFNTDRYLKTNNGNGRKISANILYVNAEGEIEPEYRIVIVDGTFNQKGYDISVSSTNQVEILDIFKPNHGILSWFPVRDFDFDINVSTYGQYGAFTDECNKMSRKITYTQLQNINDTADSDDTTAYEDSNNGIKNLARSPFIDEYGDSLKTEYGYYLEQYHPELCLISKTTPYVSKWGYYDEEKDSCENPYRLNVSKVFGVNNLSANTYLRNCDEMACTHSMPYYMTFTKPDYYKQYQYIESDKIYIDNNININDDSDDTNDYYFYDCVNYWINVFKDTKFDNFTYYFSGKKYGKRFDKKYSRLKNGDKFHNPSTLFRGVKFEVVRQLNGVEKRSSEYNNYKFSFIYIPVMVKDTIFDSKIHFVKNDTFKFIVGIVFVNTMLGIYKHNIFNGSIDYFNKGFIYSACKDIIRAENVNQNYTINFTMIFKSSPFKDSSKYVDNNGNFIFKKIKNSFLQENYDLSVEPNMFYMWKETTKYRNINYSKDYVNKKFEEFSTVFISKKNNASDLKSINDFICELDENEFMNYYIDSYKKDGTVSFLKDIIADNIEYGNIRLNENDKFEILFKEYYKDYDITIYGTKIFEKYGSIESNLNAPELYYENMILSNVCEFDDIKENNENVDFGYKIDVSKLTFKEGSLRNVLNNIGSDSILEIRFYNNDGDDKDINDKKFINGENCKITVTNNGCIEIDSKNMKPELFLYRMEDPTNLRFDMKIEDAIDIKYGSSGLKKYFSVFNQISMFNITKCINNDYNVDYYSTVEDNKYKIRVIEPDSFEIVDKFEAFPMSIIQNNKSIVGSVEIKEKQNIDNIGKKVINRYSGFYNPIFTDILYYDDYFYNKIELPYSNTNVDYSYNDGYGEFGIIKNLYYHKTNTYRSDKILSVGNPTFPAINEYALDCRDYNIFSSSWDNGYFMTQDDLNNSSMCEGIGSMKDGMCMFGSKYLNLPDDIFIDTFDNVETSWDGKMVIDSRDNTDTEIMYKEVDNSTVKYYLFIRKRLKRYLKEKLIDIFSQYINKEYSFGNKGTIEDDVDEYVEKNLLKLYRVDKVYMYIKSNKVGVHDNKINNDYIRFLNKNNEYKIKFGFPVVVVNGEEVLKESVFSMNKINEFDRHITYNLKRGFKEIFGFGVSIKRK